MSRFILFNVVSDKDPSKVGPELIEVGAIAAIKPTDAGQATRVTLKDGRALKVTGSFHHFCDLLVGADTVAAAQAQAPSPQPFPETFNPAHIAAQPDDIAEETVEDNAVEKNKNKSLTAKKK